MAKSKKKISAVVFLLIPLSIVSFLVGIQFQKIRTPQISPSQSDIYTKRIYDKISYKIPAGWNEIKSNSDNSITIVSEDYKPAYLSVDFKDGAEITLYRSDEELYKTGTDGVPRERSLEEYVNDVYGAEYREAQISSYKSLAGYQAINVYDCWEGCSDIYLFTKGSELWEIYFTCANGCSMPKEELEKKPYASARNEFLSSLELK